jgi:Tfp pilus assembly protein PilF
MLSRLSLLGAILLGLSGTGAAAIKADVPDHVARAEEALARKDLMGALAALDAAVTADPNNLNARILRGRLRADRGALDRALEDLNEAVRLDPKNATALASRGFVFQKRRELDARSRI